jgi:biotin carboxyl carrier protein
MNNVHNHQQPAGGNATAAELVEKLSQFDGSSGQFFWNLLAVQCFLGRAESGAILRSRQDEGVDILAAYPQLPEISTEGGHAQGRPTPAWLNESVSSVREAISTDATIIKPLPAPDGERRGTSHVLFIPLKMAEIGQAVEAFVIRASDRSTIETCREQLELTANLLGISERRLTLQKRQAGLRRLQKAMETLSAINRQNRFTSTAMALCNEVASQWRCERVSIGFLKGRYVQLRAMSHTEDFSRKMKIVQDIESAMEECLDQDCEVLYPASPEATHISRAAGELSKRHGPLAVLSLPLRQDGEVRAVLTLERPSGESFGLEEVEAIRLTCELCTPRLLNLYEHDRWVGARVVAKTRSALAVLVGPKHTWTKILAILILGVILLIIFGKGQFRAEAPFVLEATYQQVVCASFDGYIKSVNVEVGDTVEGGQTTLAELDTAELRLQLAAAKAERAGYLKQVAAAMRDAEIAQAQIAQADADKTEAQIELLNYLIDQGKIISPISGTVVKGDLKRQIGAPVKKGDVLFEVTPLESLRAELLVPEDQIFDIAVDQAGYLATVSYPGERIKFVVERVNPMAEVVNDRNVFKVRVRLLERRSWMRPGMEGVAKISIGERPYIWIWTRRVVNWLRMKLWL